MSISPMNCMNRSRIVWSSNLGRADGQPHLFDAVTVEIEVGPFAELQGVVGLDLATLDRPSHPAFRHAQARARGQATRSCW